MSSYLGEGDDIQIVADASPTGLGAYLKINGRVVEYAFGYITRSDEKILKVKRHGSEGQQVWEALILLCSLRLWSNWWRAGRCSLRVRSDSVSALILVVKMKTSGVGTSIIAGELALDIGDALYTPNVCEHIPGVTNVIAGH